MAKIRDAICDTGGADNDSVSGPPKTVSGPSITTGIFSPVRRSLTTVMEVPTKRLSRGSIDYGDQGWKTGILYEEQAKTENAADPNLPQELQEHKRKKRLFSRLRLKKLREARYGLYVPQSPRTVDRRGLSKENIRKIVAMLKISPRIIVRGEEKNKEWRKRPSARESAAVGELREKLQERKEDMKPFTSNKLFEKLLEITEEERVYPPPEYFWRQSISSKFEKMARELIDRTAYMTARMQNGVWSQTGMPYACLGVPSTNRPATAPLPNLKLIREKGSDQQPPFDFFPAGADTELMAEIAGKKLEERHVPWHIARREAILRAAKQTSTVSRLLMKMGLLHLHVICQIWIMQDSLRSKCTSRQS